MLMGLRGTPFLYYGDEIGMPDTDVPVDRVLDPVGVFHGRAHGPRPRAHADARGRATRVRASPSPGVEPWLPYGDVAACNVADQRHDPDSDALAHPRPHRVAQRDSRPATRFVHDVAELRTTRSGRGSAATERSSRCNLSDEPVDVPGVGAGEIRISTIRARDNERVSDALHLEPWEAAIVWRDA